MAIAERAKRDPVGRGEKLAHVHVLGVEQRGALHGARLLPQERPEPDLSKKSTPTGGGCHMKQASIFTKNIEEIYRKFLNLFSLERCKGLQIL